MWGGGVIGSKPEILLFIFWINHIKGHFFQKYEENAAARKTAPIADAVVKNMDYLVQLPVGNAEACLAQMGFLSEKLTSMLRTNEVRLLKIALS